jgi:hypothetical protein
MGKPIDGEYIVKANHTRDCLTSESMVYGVLVYTDKRGDRGSD